MDSWSWELVKIHLLSEEGSDINEFLKSAQREKCVPRRVAFHAIALLPVMPQDANCIFNQTCGFYLKQIQKWTERLGKLSVATFDMAKEKVKKNLRSSLFILSFLFHQFKYSHKEKKVANISIWYISNDDLG